ncbi:helix-turn-helix domain-containing protein [Chitinophagaceae bacterium LB-8]|uniref:Helix-turn-helix domain-containing protein n=1 Tax=Paraflavisolibacter caeni TaxID=2982496 RepID=A0A9X2XY27_9BACT|nr:helix-turn-helix domain-containing protein [Paraflavisolibacter caeni]MCU7549768.1 helix-turn-helix domain-containing protein [Paraflavisolibacter caeni]
MTFQKNAIPTFDPLKLKIKLLSTGGDRFQSFFTPASDVFHINRIEDYVRFIKVPTETDVHPFRLTLFNFIFQTKGHSLRTKGLNTYEFGENTFFFVPAYEITTHLSGSQDAEGYYCHFNIDLLTSDYRIKDLLADFPFLNFNCFPLITITDEVKDLIMPLLQRLEMEYKAGEKCRFDILRTYLITLFTELKPFVQSVSSLSNNSAYQITEKYKKALAQYIYEKQNISGYAEMLGVTPNHLNKCVKSVTGKSAHDLLNEMLLLETKVLLTQTSLSVSEIAYRMGGNELSNFVRFFKSKTGMKPGEYRKMVNPEL